MNVKSRCLATLAFCFFALSCGGSLGPRECEPGTICLTVDKLSYAPEDTIHAILHNNSAEPVVLPGCSHIGLATATDSAWVESPLLICVWEGIALKIPAGDFYQERVEAKAYPGLHKFVAEINFGCAEDKPISTARCGRQEKIFSPEFRVANRER